VVPEGRSVPCSELELVVVVAAGGGATEGWPFDVDPQPEQARRTVAAMPHLTRCAEARREDRSRRTNTALFQLSGSGTRVTTAIRIGRISAVPRRQTLREVRAELVE
jgi:hypothetical protein